MELDAASVRHQFTEYFMHHDEDFPPLGPTRQTSISSLPPGLQAESARRSTPTLPPGLEDAFQSRHGTPTIPPGLSKAVTEEQKQKIADVDKTISRPSSRTSLRRVISSQIVPAVPLRVATPVRLSSRPATPVNGSSSDRGMEADTPTAKSKAVGNKRSELANVEAVGPAQQRSAETTLDSASVRPAQDQQRQTSKRVATDPAEVGNEDRSSVMEQQTEARDATKRRHPGKLDISAARPSQGDDTHTNESSAKTSATAQKNATTSSVPPSPSTSAPSPASKAALRTIRLVQTPKGETPPAMPVPPAPVLTTAVATATRKLPSRQPSVASMTLPATPSSEHVSVSDNLSIASATQSRGNSPPPTTSKVGSAPVRAKTKSQLKKERQERAKALEEEKSKIETEDTAVVADEPAQEAIVSRKKKTRKEKESKPKAKQVKDDTPLTVEAVASSPVQPQRDTTPAAEDRPATPPAPTRGEPSPPPTPPAFTPAQLISELRAVDSTIAKSFEALFRVPPTNAKHNPPITNEDLQNPSSWQLPDYNIKLTKAEIDALLNGKQDPPISRHGGDGRVWSRTLISPNGAQLRGLSEDLERRFTELERRINNLSEEYRFRPTKPQNETQFPAFDLKALKKSFDPVSMRGVSAMEQMVQDGNAMKKGAFLVDEASKYINEFVMPPATPPQSAGRVGGNASQQHGHAAQMTTASNNVHDPAGLSVEAAERQLQEAKRAVDEREGALRRAIRKNKKLLGLA